MTESEHKKVFYDEYDDDDERELKFSIDCLLSIEATRREYEEPFPERYDDDYFEELYYGSEEQE